MLPFNDTCSIESTRGVRVAGALLPRTSQLATALSATLRPLAAKILATRGHSLAGQFLQLAVPLVLASRTMASVATPEAPKYAMAIVGGGCFWCVEAMYTSMPGVQSVESGYAGGHTENPTYEDVCGGDSGHAEVVKVTFDPITVSFERILRLFFKGHDPTTLNRQGADVGTQYRSVVFVADEAQRKVAEDLISELNASGVYSSPIVTEVSSLDFESGFYPAEAYHQDFFRRNPRHGYCRAVIAPKLEKLKTVHV
jgi:peptide-methionine (S)-S-oxide reductase